jgi:hypothetical protein
VKWLYWWFTLLTLVPVALGLWFGGQLISTAQAARPVGTAGELIQARAGSCNKFSNDPCAFILFFTDYDVVMQLPGSTEQSGPYRFHVLSYRPPAPNPTSLIGRPLSIWIDQGTSDIIGLHVNDRIYGTDYYYHPKYKYWDTLTGGVVLGTAGIALLVWGQLFVRGLGWLVGDSVGFPPFLTRRKGGAPPTPVASAGHYSRGRRPNLGKTSRSASNQPERRRLVLDDERESDDIVAPVVVVWLVTLGVFLLAGIVRWGSVQMWLAGVATFAVFLAPATLAARLASRFKDLAGLPPLRQAPIYVLGVGAIAGVLLAFTQLLNYCENLLS